MKKITRPKPIICSLAKADAEKVCIELQTSGMKNPVIYRNSLNLFSAWLRENQSGISLESATAEHANLYLAERSTTFAQKTIAADRQAIQVLLRHYNKLDPDQSLPAFRSKLKPSKPKSRSYTSQQVAVIIKHLEPHNALAVELVFAAGLKGDEVYSLATPDELKPDQYSEQPQFLGRNDHKIYAVHGASGSVRLVSIPRLLAERLEETRLTVPREMKSRGLSYRQYYAIGGGHALQMAFSRASMVAIEWSGGLMGLRHSYVHKRHFENQYLTGDPDLALSLTASELGLSRPSSVIAYLR